MKVNTRFIASAAVVLLFASAAVASQKINPAKDKRPAKQMRNTCAEAFDFLNTTRAFPNPDIPERGYTDAYNFYRSHFTSAGERGQASVTSTTTWENIGPSNLGGRTIGIAIDPNDTGIVWLGSASGGLWKSTVGGIGFQAWTYVPTGYPVRSVSCIAIDRSNSNVMYIGTGETYSYGSSVNGIVTRPTRGTAGIGILKSTDGGVTWAPSLDWSYNQLRGVWDIVINPMNSNVVYAATTEGVYKTNDAGTNWVQVLSNQMVTDIEIDRLDTNIVYAGAGDIASPNKGVYRTKNSGASWSIIGVGLPANTNRGRITITSFPDNPKALYALVADQYSTIGIYFSTDTGNTWLAKNNTNVDVVSYNGWYSKGLCVKEDDVTKVLFGGVNVFKSVSNGDNISQVTNVTFVNDIIHTDVHNIISNPLNSDFVYIVSDGGLFRSNNFGNTFYDCTNGFTATEFYAGASSQQDTAYLLGGTQGSSTARYMGFFTWEALVGGDGTSVAIDPTNDLNEFCSYPFLNILGTTDRANNFFQSFTSPNDPAGNNPAAFVAPMVICPSDPTIMYAGTNALYRSADQGIFWSIPHVIAADTGKVILSIAVSSTYTDSLYFATAPTDSTSMHVWRSTNGGVSFTNISAGLPSNRYPRKLVVNPYNSMEVYAVFGGFGTGHVFRSTNAGASWTDISTLLPDVPFHTLMIDPAYPNSIFVGSDFGVFASPDAGSDWLLLNDGLPEGVMVFDLAHCAANNSMIAFTYGHGAYKISLDVLTLGIQEQMHNVSFYQQVLNPAHDLIQLSVYSGKEGKALISVYDITGKTVKEIPLRNFVSGKNEVTIDASELQNGIYFLKTEFNGENRVSKFVLMNSGN